MTTASTVSPIGHTTLVPRRASTSLKRDEIFTLIRECDALLELEPHCLHTRAVRGHACMKAKLWTRAVADFTAILDERPDDIHARFSRGMALFKGERVDEAHTDFSRVLELNPHHVMARYARAGCYNTEGKFHHAIEEYTIALEHDEMANEVAHGLRHGKLPRVAPFDSLANGNDDTQSHSTRSASVPSPTKSSVQRETKQPEPLVEVREPAPVVAPVAPMVNSPTPKFTTAKKPRKVVQVQLNLSAFVAAPAPSAADPTAVKPSTHASAATNVPECSRLAPSPQRSARAPSIQAPVPVSSPVKSIGRINEADAPLTRAPAAAAAPAPRRVVRRVTVAL